MPRLPELERFALLLAILPQLLLLGLGRGFVVCISDGGHLQVEVAAEECCGEAGATAEGQEGLRLVSQDEPDCGSCSDFRIALDPRLSRSSAFGQVEHSPAPAALPVEPQGPPLAAGPRHGLGISLERGLAPPHLIHLRSVVLRC